MLTAAQSLQVEVLSGMLLSLFLGGLIGYEREAAHKPAGLRTHMIVAAAVTLFVHLGSVVVQQFEQSAAEMSMVRTDPIRIIEAIISGVAFLGAGTIIRRRGDVEGLTTAASILFTAAVGVAVALSQFIIAVGATAVALLTLRFVHILERRLGYKVNTHNEEKE